MKLTSDKQLQNPSSKINKEDQKENILKPQINKLSKNELRRITMSRFWKKKILGKKDKKNIEVNKIQACLHAKQYQCLICLQLMVNPTTLQCGHSFCLTCVQKLNSKASNYLCSLCRANTNYSYYQIDKNMDKIVNAIHLSKQTSNQKQQYISRKMQIRSQELKQRSVNRQLKKNQQIKIKIKNIWKRAQVISIIHTHNKAFYQIQVHKTDQCFFIARDSMNIRLLNKEELASLKAQNGQYFSFDIFLEQQYPVRPTHNSNTQNIQDLLLEVNYYPETNQYFDSQAMSYQQLPNHVENNYNQEQGPTPNLIELITWDNIL